MAVRVHETDQRKPTGQLLRRSIAEDYSAAIAIGQQGSFERPAHLVTMAGADLRMVNVWTASTRSKRSGW
jgi:hypothetical protein